MTRKPANIPSAIDIILQPDPSTGLADLISVAPGVQALMDKVALSLTVMGRLPRLATAIQ
jgi:hypothetical protein